MEDVIQVTLPPQVLKTRLIQFDTGYDQRVSNMTIGRSQAEAGIPFFIVIIILVLCALLLATIALIIVMLIFRRRKKSEAMTPDGEHQIEYSDMGKPLTTAMEVQPDLRNLEPRLDPRDPRVLMQYGHMGPRKFLQLPLDAQRRLITVPEEDSGMEERDAESPEMLIEHIPQAELEEELDFEFEGQYEDSAESDSGLTPREYTDQHQLIKN